MKSSNRKQKKVWVGLLAVFIGIIAISPVINDAKLHHSMRELHYFWLIMSIIASGLWLHYGFTNRLLPNVLNAIALLAILSYLLYEKISYEERRKKLRQRYDNDTTGIL